MAPRSSPLFDAYVFVDWSGRGSASPRAQSADAIWVGEVVRDDHGRSPGRELYFRTRSTAGHHLEDRLVEHVRRGRRVLVGCDFPYGYPFGFAASLGAPPGEPAWSFVWRTIASLVHDAPDNSNNRFAAAAALNQRACGSASASGGASATGPFWGAPVGTVIPSLPRLRPPFPFTAASATALAAVRLTEQRLRVQEAWKLYGAGSVGGQALLGLPWLARLRWHPELAAVSRVWPFEMGFASVATSSPSVLHVEIWPGTVDAAVQEHATGIRDRDQVRELARWAARQDAAGALAAYFGPPDALDDDQLRACVAEEGWIFGLHPSTVQRRRDSRARTNPAASSGAD